MRRAMVPISSLMSSTMASVYPRQIVTGYSNRTLQRGKRAPALAWPSSDALSRSTAVASNCATRQRKSRVNEAPGSVFALQRLVRPTLPNRKSQRSQVSEPMAAEILVVDDEADIRALVAGILQDEGYSAHTAHNSDDALAAIAARRPNLVFLDIWLQGSKLDGLQLLDAVKQEHPELPVVMISGHGNIETAVAAIKHGAYDFIEKPFKADRLVLVADRALETSRLRREVKQLKQMAPAQLVGKSPSMNQ